MAKAQHYKDVKPTDWTKVGSPTGRKKDDEVQKTVKCPKIHKGRKASKLEKSPLYQFYMDLKKKHSDIPEVQGLINIQKVGVSGKKMNEMEKELVAFLKKNRRALGIYSPHHMEMIKAGLTLNAYPVVLLESWAEDDKVYFLK